MVNVAGRSKGCSTCRKRRVKCDEARPICKRCQRSGLQCDGPKGTAFVEATIVASRRSEKRLPVSTGYDPRAIGYAKCQIPLSLSCSSHEIDIYLCYTLKHLRGGPVELALQGVDHSDIVAARRTTASGHIFHQAIVSFAAIFFGMQHRQTSITNQGYAILGTSLSRLNQALSDSKIYVSDDVLLSVITLALLESFVPSSPRQYLNHMLALEKLLELRGPLSISPGLVSGVRYMILFASLRTKKPSILAQAEWKRVLREGCSKDDMQEQDLFDVIADCSVLLAEHDKTSATTTKDLKADLHHQEDAEQTAMASLFYLHAWRMRWNADKSNVHYETPSILPIHSPIGKSFEDCTSRIPTVFEFANVSAAMLLMLYNTALIYVLQILDSLSCKLPGAHLSSSLTNNSWPNAGDSDTEHGWMTIERSAALDNCRCIPYLARQSVLDLRVIHLAVTTLWATIRGNDSPVTMWMRHILNTKGQEMIARGLRPDDHNADQDSNNTPASAEYLSMFIPREGLRRLVP